MALDPVILVALALLAGGVVGSLLPFVPGGLLSLAGVYLFWWSNGFGSPGVGFVVVATLLGVAAVVADSLGTPIAAGAAGVSPRAAVIAGVVGVALFPITGPFGVLLGAAGTVYLAQRRRGRPRRESVQSALETVVGMVLAGLVELLLTLAILVGFVVVLL